MKQYRERLILGQNVVVRFENAVFVLPNAGKLRFLASLGEILRIISKKHTLQLAFYAHF